MEKVAASFPTTLNASFSARCFYSSIGAGCDTEESKVAFVFPRPAAPPLQGGEGLINGASGIKAAMETQRSVPACRSARPLARPSSHLSCRRWSSVQTLRLLDRRHSALSFHPLAAPDEFRRFPPEQDFTSKTTNPAKIKNQRVIFCSDGVKANATQVPFRTDC